MQVFLKLLNFSQFPNIYHVEHAIAEERGRCQGERAMVYAELLVKVAYITFVLLCLLVSCLIA